MDKELQQWVEHTVGADSWRTIAEKLRTTHSTIKRRLNNHEADAIVEIARSYGANPLHGLLAAGIVTRSDLVQAAGLYSVDDLDDVELAQLLVDRLTQRESESDTDSMPLHAVADSSPDEGEGYPDDYEP